MEIDRTELIYQTAKQHSKYSFHVREYGEKPLVLDPDDTILVPLKKITVDDFQAGLDSFWGILEFRFADQNDLYCLRHHFRKDFSEMMPEFN